MLLFILYLDDPTHCYIHGFVIFVNMDFSLSIFRSVHILRFGGAAFLFSFYTLMILHIVTRICHFVNMDYSFSIFGSVLHNLRLGGASFLFSFYTLTILNSRHKERRWLSIHCERDLKKSTALLPNLRNIFFSCLKFNHAFHNYHLVTHSF